MCELKSPPLKYKDIKSQGTYAGGGFSVRTLTQVMLRRPNSTARRENTLTAEPLCRRGGERARERRNK